MSKVAALTGLAILLAAGPAIGASKVRVDKADVDFSTCQTFAWRAQSADAASFTDQRVRAAVMEQLKAKGYTEVTENADCGISYVLTKHEVAASKPSVGVGVGGGSGGIGISLPIGGKRETATFTIDIIDSAKNAQIWSGSLDIPVKSGDLTEGDAKGAAKKVLAQYPDRTDRKQP